jgi:hypothetical protein
VAGIDSFSGNVRFLLIQNEPLAVITVGDLFTNRQEKNEKTVNHMHGNADSTVHIICESVSRYRADQVL